MSLSVAIALGAKDEVRTSEGEDVGVEGDVDVDEGDGSSSGSFKLD